MQATHALSVFTVAVPRFRWAKAVTVAMPSEINIDDISLKDNGDSSSGLGDTSSSEEEEKEEGEKEVVGAGKGRASEVEPVLTPLSSVPAPAPVAPFLLAFLRLMCLLFTWGSDAARCRNLC